MLDRCRGRLLYHVPYRRCCQQEDGDYIERLFAREIEGDGQQCCTTNREPVPPLGHKEGEGKENVVAPGKRHAENGSADSQGAGSRKARPMLTQEIAQSCNDHEREPYAHHVKAVSSGDRYYRLSSTQKPVAIAKDRCEPLPVCQGAVDERHKAEQSGHHGCSQCDTPVPSDEKEYGPEQYRRLDGYQ